MWDGSFKYQPPLKLEVVVGICCVCHHIGRETPASMQFPFSKFRSGYHFCDEHTKEIRDNPERIHVFEKLLGL